MTQRATQEEAVREPGADRRRRPARMAPAFVRRNALAIGLTAIALAAVVANVAPDVIKVLLQALGLQPLGEGVTMLLVHLTEGLVVLLLLALYVEQRPFRRLERGLGRLRVDVSTHLADIHEQLQLQLNQLHLEHLRQHMLRHELQDMLVDHYDNPMGNLLDLVLPQGVNPALKAQISIRLLTLEQPDQVIFDYRGQFAIRQREYIIGMVSSKGHGDRLIDANAPIHQVFVLPETDRMEALTADQAVERYHVRLQYLDERTSKWRDALPEPVARPETIWNPSHPEDTFPLMLLRLDLPADPTGGPRLVRLTYRHPVAVREGFTFWAATRPIYVERIDIDTSGLRNVKNLRLERFLPNFDRSETSDLATNRIFTIVVQNWILKGHGVLLCWQSALDD